MSQLRGLLVLCALAGAAPAFAQDCVNPQAPPDDCDEDGFSTAEDDCDDEDDSVFPGAMELCGDGVDNNCNAIVDDECELRDGELSGGSGCGADDGWALIILPWWILLRKRREC